MTLNSSTSKMLNYLCLGVFSASLLLLSAVPSSAQRGTVCSFITASVNVRSSPGTNHRIVGGLRRGNVVRASHRQGNWVRLTGRVFGTVPRERVTSYRGWVSNRYIDGCSEDQFDRWRR